MIDSHCHLADDDVRRRTSTRSSRGRREAGLERALVILEAGNEQEAAQARRVEALWPEVRVCDRRASARRAPVRRRARSARPTSCVRQVADTPSARAVGEIGLDYHYDFSPRDVQQQVFRAQLRLARELDAAGRHPHARGGRGHAGDSAARRAGSVRGVLHCFTGTPAWRARASTSASTSRWPASSRSRKPATCGRPRGACRSIGCWSKPTARFWRPCRTAASATSRRYVAQVVAALADLLRHDAGRTGASDRPRNFHTPVPAVIKF